jgi:hypothetical protein
MEPSDKLVHHLFERKEAEKTKDKNPSYWARIKSAVCGWETPTYRELDDEIIHEDFMT